MKILLKLTTLLIISSTLIVSCGKEDPNEGCTDITAINFNNLARVDDGSCEYLDSTINIWSNGEIGFWGNFSTGSFDLKSCLTNTTTIFTNPDTVITPADTIIDTMVTPPDTTITPADTTINGETNLLVDSDSQGNYELIIRLLNQRNASEFANGRLIFNAKMHPDATIANFDVIINGNNFNTGDINCSQYLSSSPFGVSTSPLDTLSFKEVSIPLISFQGRNLQNMDLVFGIRGNGATPNTSLIIINDVRWIAADN